MNFTSSIYDSRVLNDKQSASILLCIFLILAFLVALALCFQNCTIKKKQTVDYTAPLISGKV